MGQLLDLVRLLKLDTPEALVTPTPTDFVGPIQPPPEPAPLTGWRGVVDRGIDTVVGGLKGLTGVGDQGPAGMTATNAGQVLGAAMPLAGVLGKFPRFAAALEKYHTPGQAPFYSRLDDAVGSLNASAAPAKVLSVAKGATTAEEVAARGLPEFVAGYGNKPVPKAALVEHLAAHPVRLKVKTLGGDAQIAPRTDASYTLRRSNGVRENWVIEDAQGRAIGASNSREMAEANAQEWAARVRAGEEQQLVKDAGPPTKFSQYQVPGGTNYKETLITLPTKMVDESTGVGWTEVRQNIHGDQQWYRVNWRGEWEDAGKGFPTRAAAEAQLTAPQVRQVPSADNFRSSHFDEPNIVVHTRSNERTIPELGKGTFLEEVQSDWHQKGKAEGYKLPSEVTAPMDSEYRALVHKNADARAAGREPLAADMKRAKELEDALIRADSSKIPNAPFKDTWPDLALKHHLADAAQNPDTHWLGFTSGETQKVRYSLEKHFDTVKAFRRDDGAFDFSMRRKAIGPDAERRGWEDVTNVPANKLGDAVGKELAAKLVAQPTGWHAYEGVDLKMGGEGMHAFYDNLLPKRLQKIVEKYGGKVEQTQMPTQAYVPGTMPDWLAAGAKKETVAAWIVRLTPEIKARILKEGIPLFTGAVLAGAASQQEQAPPKQQTR